MARPKEYDREKVLAAATELFWRKGFHGTSLSELVAATKLNKQSMYQEFGSKAGLFNATLEYYSTMMGKKVMGILKAEPLGTDNIKKLFACQQEMLTQPDFKGCLFINTAGEQDHIDEQATARVKFFFSRLKEMFYNCLITKFPKRAAEVRADYFVHLFSGIMTVGKVRHDSNDGKDLLKLALHALEK